MRLTKGSGGWGGGSDTFDICSALETEDNAHLSSQAQKSSTLPTLGFARR